MGKAIGKRLFGKEIILKITKNRRMYITMTFVEEGQDHPVRPTKITHYNVGAIIDRPLQSLRHGLHRATSLYTREALALPDVGATAESPTPFSVGQGYGLAASVSNKERSFFAVTNRTEATRLTARS